LFLLINVLFSQFVFSQQNTDSLINEIRTKYYLMTNNFVYDSVFVEEPEPYDDTDEEIMEEEAEYNWKNQYYYNKGKLVYIEKYYALLPNIVI